MMTFDKTSDHGRICYRGVAVGFKTAAGFEGVLVARNGTEVMNLWAELMSPESVLDNKKVYFVKLIQDHA